MKTQTTAIQSELTRVRNLKRALETEVELLRSDAECGKLHIRVNKASEFRQALAKAIVDSSSSGNFSWNHLYYVDAVDGIIYKKDTTVPWNPWPESISWRIVPIESLFPNYDFSPEIEDWSSVDTWESCDINFSDIVKAYLIEEGEELEENGDIPEWTLPFRDDIVSFGFNSEFGHYLEAIEAGAKQRTIGFALESINDEIVIEINL